LQNPYLIALLIFALIGLFSSSNFTGGFLVPTTSFQLDILQASGANRQSLSENILEVYAGEPAVGTVETSSYEVQLGIAATLPVCGNSIIEAPEQCDGDNVGGISCASIGFLSGRISCEDDCTYDVEDCEGVASGAALGEESRPTIRTVAIGVGESEEFELEFGDSLNFDLAGQDHKIRVSGVINDSVELEFSSHTFREIFQLGETKDFDLTENDVDDIRVALLMKLDNAISLRITALEETITVIFEIPPEEAPAEGPIVSVGPSAFFFAPLVGTTEGQALVALIIIGVASVLGFAVYKGARRRRTSAIQVKPEAPEVRRKKDALHVYLDKAIESGANLDAVRQKLMEQGWPDSLIRAVLQEIRSYEKSRKK
jgi:hypothetical protein